MSLMAAFVFGCLFKLIVCLIEISAYFIDIVSDLEIVWIGFLGLGRGVPCLDDGLLRCLQVWKICAQRELRRSRRGHHSLANQHASSKDRRDRDGARYKSVFCHGKTSSDQNNRPRRRAGKRKSEERRRVLCEG